LILDVTPAVTPSLAVWPGDSPASREILMDLSRGDVVTLSTLLIFFAVAPPRAG
jgi:kynurenine formamidase